MRLRETTNEYDTPVVEYQCETCGVPFTICPAPTPDKDDQWRNCICIECPSYDASRDVNKWFDEGRVRSIPNGDGSSRLVPFWVIDGGST